MSVSMYISVAFSVFRSVSVCVCVCVCVVCVFFFFGACVGKTDEARVVGHVLLATHTYICTITFTHTCVCVYLSQVSNM